MINRIELTDVSKRYRTADGNWLVALDHCCLSMHAAESVIVTGDSGSGKTTLLLILGCLTRADSGTVVVRGSDVSRKDNRAIESLRRNHIGMLFQSYNLLGHLTVLDNISLAIRIKNNIAKQAARREGRRLLEQLGLADKAGERPSNLSGGEQQRVALMRTLIKRPDIILLDEPTSNLDADNAQAVREQLSSYARAHRPIMVIASHDERLEELADRQIHLAQGRVTREGARVHSC